MFSKSEVWAVILLVFPDFWPFPFLMKFKRSPYVLNSVVYNSVSSVGITGFMLNLGVHSHFQQMTVFAVHVFCTNNFAQSRFVDSCFTSGIRRVLFIYHISMVFARKLLCNIKIKQAYESWHTDILCCWQRLFILEKRFCSEWWAHLTSSTCCFFQSVFLLWRGHCCIEIILRHRVLEVYKTLKYHRWPSHKTFLLQHFLCIAVKIARRDLLHFWKAFVPQIFFGTGEKSLKTRCHQWMRNIVRPKSLNLSIVVWKATDFPFAP